MPQSTHEQLVSDGLMSVREACAFTGIGRSEIYCLMGRGELAYVQHGRRRLIPRRGLVALLASRVRGGEAAVAVGI